MLAMANMNELRGVYMPNGTEETARAAEGGTRPRAPRTNPTFRTSEATDDAVRSAIANVTLVRGGRRKPSADLVILAALRLASTDGRALADKVTEIEEARSTEGGS